MIGALEHPVGDQPGALGMVEADVEERQVALPLGQGRGDVLQDQARLPPGQQALDDALVRQGIQGEDQVVRRPGQGLGQLLRLEVDVHRGTREEGLQLVGDVQAGQP